MRPSWARTTREPLSTQSSASAPVRSGQQRNAGPWSTGPATEEQEEVTWLWWSGLCSCDGLEARVQGLVSKCDCPSGSGGYGTRETWSSNSHRDPGSLTASQVMS